MKVWLVHPGELLPLVDKNPRPFRYSFFADALCARGHKVTRFAPTFAHATKFLRANGDRLISLSEDYDLCLVHAGSYKNHRGLRRYIFYQKLARRFAKVAVSMEKPEVIVCGIPTAELCRECLNLGSRFNIPVVLDIRDLWPDIYLNLLPGPLRSLGRFLIAPMFKRMSSYLAKADGRIAVSQQYMEWAQRLSGVDMGARDRVIYLGSSSVSGDLPSQEWLAEHGILKGKLLICFAGQFEPNYDISTILDVAAQAEERGLEIQILMAGAGRFTSRIEEAAQELSTLVHLGWLDRDEMHGVLLLSDVGLCSYSKDALQSLPNKPFEYMGAGLMLLSSLKGELAALIDEQAIGINYEPGDGDSMLAAIERLFSDPRLVAASQARSLNLFNDAFNAEKLGDMFVDYLEVCVQNF